MDSEDRDHFKTIRLASVGPQSGSQQSSSKETSSSRPDPAYCLRRAKAICGCYRRDEAQDPETFAAALALVLGDYPTSIVDFIADPRTGVITKYPMGLPNVGQIKQFCDDTLRQQERLEHYAKLPKAPPRVILPPPVREPGTDYMSMFEKYGRPIGFFETVAGNARDIPPTDPVAEKARLEAANKAHFERECRAEGIDPSRGVSPSLLKTLQQPEGSSDEF